MVIAPLIQCSPVLVVVVKLPFSRVFRHLFFPFLFLSTFVLFSFPYSRENTFTHTLETTFSASAPH